MKIITLQASHANILHTLHATIQDPWEKPWTASSYANMLNQPSTLGLAIEEENKGILSYLIVQKIGDEAEILFLMTALSHQRQGLAKKLYEHFLSMHHPHLIHLEVCANNTAALGFYERHGFSVIGLRKNYYKGLQGQHFDGVMMKHTR